MLYVNLSFPLPEELGYEVLTLHGHRYLYCRIRSQRVAGKLKHTRLCLGRLTEDGTSFMPNDAWFARTGQPVPPHAVAGNGADRQRPRSGRRQKRTFLRTGKQTAWTRV